MTLFEFCNQDTKYLKLLQEWDYQKNNDLNPSNILKSSTQKVWWKHTVVRNGKTCNHSWEASVAKRIFNNTGCPYCNNRLIIPEENSLEALYPNVAKRWDYKKNGDIKPNMIPPHSGKKYFFNCTKGHSFETKVTHMVDSKINCPICNLEKKSSIAEMCVYFYIYKYYSDAQQQVKLFSGSKQELDIFIPSKKIAIEYDGQRWHKDKERDVLKNKICADENIILYRIREPLCPILNDTSIDIILDNLSKKELSNKIKILISLITSINIENICVDIDKDFIDIINMKNYLSKENSIVHSNYNLVSEWNFNKNGNLKPNEVTAGSHKKVWWKCKNNHEWEASVSHRCRGEKCPYCSNKKVLQGFNDIGTLAPELIPYWHCDIPYTKFFNQSTKIISWKCPNCEEIWNEKIYNINKRKIKCKYCNDSFKS